MPKDDTFKNMKEEELSSFFIDMFYHELESWFNADIACCDYCYAEYLNKWPAADYSRNFEFQRKCMSLDCFFSGSLLSHIFTLEEFNKYIGLIECPNCGSSLCENFWPFEVGFDIPDNFEGTLTELNDIARRTPFMMLSHPFAKKALSEIKKLGHEVKPLLLDNCYRARRLEPGKKYNSDDFRYPPRTKIEEGRYNHAGYPVIYLGDSEMTCFYELRKPNQGIAIAEVKNVNTIKILDLIELGDVWDSVLNAAAWSSLMSSPVEGEGWYKPHYVFTRFIADCSISAGFDAIKYPSVRKGNNSNIVLLDGVEAWESLRVTSIIEMTATECEEKIQQERHNRNY